MSGTSKDTPASLSALSCPLLGSAEQSIFSTNSSFELKSIIFTVPRRKILGYIVLAVCFFAPFSSRIFSRILSFSGGDYLNGTGGKSRAKAGDGV